MINISFNNNSKITLLIYYIKYKKKLFNIRFIFIFKKIKMDILLRIVLFVTIFNLHSSQTDAKVCKIFKILNYKQFNVKKM